MKILALMLLVSSGCTFDRMASDINTFLDRSEIGYGYHINGSQRWRVGPNRQLAITTANPADRINRERLLTAARGLERTFSTVTLFDNTSLLPSQTDIVLVIGWPDRTAVEPTIREGWQVRFLPIEKMLPKLAKTQPIKLWLYDAGNQALINKLELEVDPAFWTPAKFDLDLLEHAFANLGAHLSAT